MVEASNQRREIAPGRSPVAVGVLVVCLVAITFLAVDVRSRLGDADTTIGGLTTAVAGISLVLIPLTLWLVLIGLLLQPPTRRAILPTVVAAVACGVAVVSLVSAVRGLHALRSADVCTAVGIGRAGEPGTFVESHWFPPTAECAVIHGPGDDPNVIVSYWAVWFPVLAVPVAMGSVVLARRARRRNRVYLAVS